MQNQPEQLSADLLLVSHHGSRTSSTTPFVEAVAPSASAISSGYRNRYGHPHPVILARLREQGVVANTAREGALQWYFGAQVMSRQSP